ncbi:hypothetical protein QYM36_000972, partial [Artemia franciscana]
MKTRNFTFENSSQSVPVMGECISARLCDDPSESASNFEQPTKRHYEEISNPDDDVAIQKTRKTPNNSGPSVPVIDPVTDECISARLCVEPSANASNFVQSRKTPLEDISSLYGDGVIPKSKKTRNLSSKNSSLSVPVIDECISTRLCDDLSGLKENDYWKQIYLRDTKKILKQTDEIMM